MKSLLIAAALTLWAGQAAAQDERIRDDVEFVNFFAGYYDAFDFVNG